MHICRKKCLITVLLMGLACFAGLSHAAKRFSPKNDAYLEKDFRTMALVYYQRILVDTYKSVGLKDAEWDKPAIAFLEMCAREYSNQPDKPDFDTLFEAGKELVSKAKCKDPLVLYCYGSILQRSGRSMAVSILRRATDGFKETPYPKVIAYLAPARLAYGFAGGSASGKAKGAVGEQTTGDASTAQALAIQWAAIAVVEGSFKGPEVRLVWKDLHEDIGMMFKGKIKDLYSAMAEKEGAHPWLLNMVKGDYYRLAALAVAQPQITAKSRGKSTVSDDMIKKFENYMFQAGAFYKKAWKAQPEFPEAATMMLATLVIAHPGKVASGLSKKEDPMVWLERAVAAQFDYAPAYDLAFSALSPSFKGGSHDAMVDLGRDCLGTKRFDTIVPDYMCLTVLNICRGMEDPEAYLKKSGVLRDVTKAINGVLDESSRSGEHAIARTRLAIVLWLAGKHADARTLLDELGEDTDASVFTDFGISANLLHSELSVQSHSFAKRTSSQAERLYASGKPGKALEKYQKFLPKAEDDAPYLAWMEDRMAVLSIEAHMKSSTEDGIDIMPKEDLNGWRTLGGDWSLEEDGAILFQAISGRNMLICKAKIGDSFEFRGEFKFIKATVNEAHGGIIFGYAPAREKAPKDICGFSFYKQAAAVFTRNFSTQGEPARIRHNAKGQNTFRIEVNKGSAKFYVNGSAVLGPIKVKLDPAGNHVGLGCYSAFSGTQIRYSKLELLPFSPETKTKTKE